MDAEPSPKYVFLALFDSQSLISLSVFLFRKSVTVVTHELYSNRVRRGTPEESRPSSPKVYRSVSVLRPFLGFHSIIYLSPIELSDDDFPVLPPSPKESKESLKPFALRSHVPVTLSQRLRWVFFRYFSACSP